MASATNIQMLDVLPLELVYMIALNLDVQSLAQLTLTARPFHDLLKGALLQKGMEGGIAMIWATDYGDADLVSRIIDEDECRGHNSSSRGRPTEEWTEHYQAGLSDACSKGYADVVKVLLQRLPQLNPDLDTSGHKCLWRAALLCHTEVLRALLVDGRADIEGEDDLGQTALRMAVEGYDPEVESDADSVRVLLEFGADPFHGDLDDVTPPHRAAYHSFLELIDIFAAHDPACVTTVKVPGTMTPVQFAVYAGRLESVKRLAALGADLCARDAEGNTLLAVATRNNITMSEFLLTQPGVAADIDGPRRPHTRWTMLLEAASRGQDHMVWLLLRAGADLNIRDEGGRSALLLAVQGQHLEAMAQLIAAGADPTGRESELVSLRDIWGYEGSTPLACAAGSGRSAALGAMLREGPAGLQAAETDCSPLACAVRNGRGRAVELLLERGADVNMAYTVDEAKLAALKGDEETKDEADKIEAAARGPALFIAVQMGDKAMLARLLRAPAVDRAVRDYKGRSLAQKAVECGEAEMLGLLEKAGYTLDEPQAVMLAAERERRRAEGVGAMQQTLTWEGMNMV